MAQSPRAASEIFQEPARPRAVGAGAGAVGAGWRRPRRAPRWPERVGDPGGDTPFSTAATAGPPGWPAKDGSAAPARGGRGWAVTGAVGAAMPGSGAIGRAAIGSARDPNMPSNRLEDSQPARASESGRMARSEHFIDDGHHGYRERRRRAGWASSRNAREENVGSESSLFGPVIQRGIWFSHDRCEPSLYFSLLTCGSPWHGTLAPCQPPRDRA